MLKALATEPEYRVRIEVIRQTQPNISLDDLWLSVGRLPYPLESNKVAFAAMKLTSNAKRYQKEKYKEREESVWFVFTTILACHVYEQYFEKESVVILY